MKSEGLRTLLRAGLVVLGAFALAALARYRLVEPSGLAHLCDPDPWQPDCVLRSLVIQTFQQHAIGWVALVVACVSLLLRRAWLAYAALAAGMAGLVLYSYEPSAVAVLLAGLALSRSPSAGPAARGRGGSNVTSTSTRITPK